MDEHLKAHKQIHSLDSWRVFRILAEFVDGFEAMTLLGPSVAIFGSSTRMPQDPKYYELAVQIAKKIAEKGFGIITGGGPGIMEAANKGAQQAKGKSCGLCINLPSEDRPNPYIDSRYELNFRYFFVRKVMFVRYAQAFIVLPGGYGTLDELFESMTLIQTKKIKPFPVYMVGKEYWKGLVNWLEHKAVKEGNITEDDFKLFTLTDDPNEIADGIEVHYRKTKSLENF